MEEKMGSCLQLSVWKVNFGFICHGKRDHYGKLEAFIWYIDCVWIINQKPGHAYSYLGNRTSDLMSPSASCQQSPQALEYLFKFIVQSRILYSRATCGMEEDQFRASIQDLFQSIRFVLSLDSRSSENLVFTQVRRSRHAVLFIFSLLRLCSLFFFECMTHLLIFFCLFHFCIPYLLFTSEICPHVCPIPGLLSDSFGGVIIRMPVCGHALRLSPNSVSHSAPLRLFYHAAARGPRDEVIWS